MHHNENVLEVWNFLRKLTINKLHLQVVVSQGIKKGSLIDFLVLKSCPRRIRTTTNRTKTCCATITPLDNAGAKI